ncbi:MAG: glutathione S-transferase family protein [Myxococcales bacterium]|nr:glutathione S-transferase family protein [Myxococcales bacterium]
MGLLIDGQWHDRWYDTKSSGGRFVRSEAQCRNQVGAEQDGHIRFPVEKDRYHLYVSMACPWAHRTLIFRAIKGLEDVISVSTVDALMLEHGWKLSADDLGPVADVTFMHEVYTRSDPAYSGRVTVPVLWDKKQQVIVNNESSEIIRMFDTVFSSIATDSDGIDSYPAHLREEIDEVNARVYDTVNNGVYRAGFATSQHAYTEAVTQLFGTLDWLEQRLNHQTWLVGETLTEADWRLFTTLIRFDAIYHGHFKCNLRRLADYPNLTALTRRLCQMPKIAGTIDLKHAHQHYYGSHASINPTGIIPIGPATDLAAFL